MTARPTPQDLLLYLRTRCPPLARRLDGALGMGIARGELRIRVVPGGWFETELAGAAPLLARLAAEVFGVGLRVVLEPAEARPLPLPVAATKVWNHVAFWARGAPQAAVALRKPRYLERWVPLASAPAPRLAEERADPEVFARTYETPADLPPGETTDTWCLPPLVEDLCGLAREGLSYVQILLPFPGDPEADRLEARLLAVKEWGTPRVPAPILQKFVGRLHYLAPGECPVGLRAAETLAAKAAA